MDAVLNIIQQHGFALLQGPYAWIMYLVSFGIAGALMFAWASIMPVIWTYGERRIAGFIQGRLGPNRVGPWGILQPFADGIKLLVKEDTIPVVAWKFLYTMAPLVVFTGAFIPLAALPFSDRIYVVNMDVALFYVIAFEALEVIGILMAGWAPGSKWSLYGGMRLAAQMLSYEVPMGLCVLVIVILTGSLNFGEIVEWQSRNAFGMEHPWILGWAIFRSPAAFIAFVIFYVGGLASTKRAPFDLPEAESELVAGYHTEYSGMRFAFFFMAEYASMYLICALAVLMFLGGWHGPIPRPDLPADLTLTGKWLQYAGDIANNTLNIDTLFAYIKADWKVFTDFDSWLVIINQGIGALNVIIKSFVLYFVMIWVRWTLPRIRIDQVMYICLKVLLPFSLGCVIFALIQVALLG